MGFQFLYAEWTAEIRSQSSDFEFELINIRKLHLSSHIHIRQHNDDASIYCGFPTIRITNVKEFLVAYFAGLPHTGGKVRSE